MLQPPSIFNDVIGPVMVGPSSSHTAASVRIGYLIRHLVREAPEKVVFEFSRQGSLALCHEQQGSDMGLAGGLLGFAMEDSRLADSIRLAKEVGICLEFHITNDPVSHPNLYRFVATGGGHIVSGEAISTGGGMITLQQVNGFEVDINGGFYETLCFLGQQPLPTVQDIIARLMERLTPANSISKHHNATGETLLLIQSRQPLALDLLNGLPIAESISLPPVLPILSQKIYPPLYHTAAEIETIAATEGLSLWEIAIRYEAARGGITPAEVLAKMDRLVSIIEHTIAKVSLAPKDFPNRILGPQAHRLAHAPLFPNPTLNEAIRHITWLMEAKSSLEVIVAAPTAGSCGCLPGTLLGVAKSLDLPREAVVKAMLAAGFIGVLIAKHSTFAGEVGGCQAECGSASGMTAAGLVQLQGGTTTQCLTAASMALQNVFGLVCDPVADRVEVPCLGKNIMAGANAIAMADLALAGFDGVIPLDETIQAMYKVGLTICPELRCTGLGGLATTPASQLLRQKLSC